MDVLIRSILYCTAEIPLQTQNLKNFLVAIAIVAAILVSSGFGYTVGSGRIITTTRTTTAIVSSTNFATSTTSIETTTIVEGNNFLEYNFTGNGTITEDDLSSLLSNFTTFYSNTTHLQWHTNATVFTFNATRVSASCSDVDYNLTFSCDLLMDGYGAAYFGGGVQWANSTRWLGTFQINDSKIPNGVVGYFSSLESFLSMRGLYLASSATSFVPQKSFLVRCIVTEYQVWELESFYSYSTTFTTSTQSYPVTTYQSRTTAGQTIGYITTTTNTFAGTTTGALAFWNNTACTYISG